jgi:hypothetical protein
MKELIVIGRMDHRVDNTFESINRVYDRGGVQLNYCHSTGTGMQDIEETKTWSM